MMIKVQDPEQKRKQTKTNKTLAQRNTTKPGMVSQAYNPKAQNAETGGLLQA